MGKNLREIIDGDLSTGNFFEGLKYTSNIWLTIHLQEPRVLGRIRIHGKKTTVGLLAVSVCRDNCPPRRRCFTISERPWSVIDRACIRQIRGKSVSFHVFTSDPNYKIFIAEIEIYPLNIEDPCFKALCLNNAFCQR